MPAVESVLVGLVEPFIGNLVIVEGIEYVACVLAAAETLACDKDGIAWTGLVQGPANRLQTVWEDMSLARMIVAIQNVVDDGERLLAARIVAGDHSNVSRPFHDSPHPCP